MKIKILFVAALLITSFGAFGQNKSKTAEEKCEILTNKMDSFYGLTDSQTTTIKAVNLKFINDETKLRSEYKSSPETLKTKKKELQNQYDEKILSHLDAAQKEKYRSEAAKRNQKQDSKNIKK